MEKLAPERCHVQSLNGWSEPGAGIAVEGEGIEIEFLKRCCLAASPEVLPFLELSKA